MLRWIFTYMLCVVAIQSFAIGEDTTRLYFDLDVDSLSYNSKAKLQDFLRKNDIDRYKSIIIIGYTDYLGTEEYNIVLSKERARNVAYYLLENDVKEQNITVCMGRGKVERKGMSGSQGYANDRRVDVVVVDKPKPPVAKPNPKKPGPKRDPMDMTVVMKPGQKRPPIPDDMKNIPLYSSPSKKADRPKKPETTYKVTDSGNIYVVMRPGSGKSNMPDEIQDLFSKPSAKPDPYQSKNELDLSKIKAGETFVLKNIYFFPQSHTVREESLPEMEKLSNALKKYTSLKIQIEGHICCVLDYPDAFDVDAQDNHLSVNRARYIYEYLLSKGISRDRLKYVGFGRSHPVIENERSETDADQNRRVEIRILEK